MDDVTRQWTLNASDELAVKSGCYFSAPHAEKVCRFIEEFAHLSQGRWAGQRLKLMPWQDQFVRRLFGWRAPDGKRRFRSAFLLAAKKQGKSPLMSALGLYLLLADGEAAPEVHVCACDRDQASIIYTEAERMVQFSPALQRRVEVIPSRKMIIAGHGKLVANSSDSPKLDGINASAVLHDEVHRQPNRLLFDVMRYAVAAREQPLTISITTAGEEESGIWWELLDRSLQVEAGIIEDVTHLGVIYRASEEDDIDRPDTWRKANPSLGVTFSEADFKRDLEEAKRLPADLASFKRLRLNIVTLGESKFIDINAWDACSGTRTDPAGNDYPTYIGLDLSASDDLTAMVGITGNFEVGFDVGARFWLPENRIVELEKRHSQPYRQWAQEGLIALTPGDVIDCEFIERAVVDLAESRNVKSIYIDPFNARTLGPALKDKHGLPVEYLRQGFLSLNSPTKTLADLVIAGKLRHEGNPILRWHMSNCVVKTDPAGNHKLDKTQRRRKIDGAAALVDAVAGAMALVGEDTGSVYEKRGVLSIDISGPARAGRSMFPWIS
jgi:phage terminase large subunit-like protein